MEQEGVSTLNSNEDERSVDGRYLLLPGDVDGRNDGNVGRSDLLGCQDERRFRVVTAVEFITGITSCCNCSGSSRCRMDGRDDGCGTPVQSLVSFCNGCEAQCSAAASRLANESVAAAATP